MSQPPEEERLHRVLDLARAAVIELKPELAMEYLQEIWPDVQAHPDTPFSVDYEIVLGDALADRRDDAADYHYKQAIAGLQRLSERQPKLEMIAHQHFGNHLRLGHRVSGA